MVMQTLGLPNEKHPSENLVTGGAPSEAMLKEAAGDGINYVIDLRPANERSFDEPAVAESLGMDFIHLPIVGPDDMTLDNVKVLDNALAQAGDLPVLLHCASGNRVGALMALRAAWLQDADLEAALQTGRDHGLTKMEAPIRALLERGKPSA